MFSKRFFGPGHLTLFHIICFELSPFVNLAFWR